jgi:hypothetical protein
MDFSLVRIDLPNLIPLIESYSNDNLLLPDDIEESYVLLFRNLIHMVISFP